MSACIGIASHQLLLRTLLREHLGQHCGIRVAAEFSCGEELQQQPEKLKGIDLLLIDGELPGKGITDTLERLDGQGILRRIAILTDTPGAYLAHCVYRFSLQGVLHKRDTLENIESALVTMLAGGIHISANLDVAQRCAFARVLPGMNAPFLGT